MRALLTGDFFATFILCIIPLIIPTVLEVQPYCVSSR